MVTSDGEILAQAILDAFTTEDQGNVVEAINSLAVSIKYLGNGDASTPMGAIEAFSMKLTEAADTIAQALGDFASAMDERGRS